MISNIIQRSSFFNPKSISGLALWLDTADTPTVQVDGSNFVTGFSDKSGFGRNLTPNANRMTYVPNAYNGYGTIRCNGDNQLLQTPVLSVDTFFGSGRNTISIFAVWKYTPGGSAIAWRAGTTSNNDRIVAFTSNSFTLVWNTVSFNIIPIPSTSNLYILGLVFDGINSKQITYYGNSSQTAEQSFNLSMSSADIRFYMGNEVVAAWSDMCEFCIYNRALPVGEVNSLRSYFSSKWRTI